MEIAYALAVESVLTPVHPGSSARTAGPTPMSGSRTPSSHGRRARPHALAQLLVTTNPLPVSTDRPALHDFYKWSPAWCGLTLWLLSRSTVGSRSIHRGSGCPTGQVIAPCVCAWTTFVIMHLSVDGVSASFGRASLRERERERNCRAPSVTTKEPWPPFPAGPQGICMRRRGLASSQSPARGHVPSK